MVNNCRVPEESFSTMFIHKQNLSKHILVQPKMSSSGAMASGHSQALQRPALCIFDGYHEIHTLQDGGQEEGLP